MYFSVWECDPGNEFSCDAWHRALASYPVVLDVLANTKRKAGAGDQLRADDVWYRGDLAQSYAQQGHVDRDALVRIIDWKHGRGRFRPRNRQFAASNEPDTIMKLTREALAHMRSVVKGGRKTVEGDNDAFESRFRKAVTCLTQLKGVGPATSTAILGCVEASGVGFMSDEALRAVKDGDKGYGVAQGVHLQAALRAQASALNTACTCAPDTCHWTPIMVERAVWALEAGRKLGVGEVTQERGTEKRARPGTATAPIALDDDGEATHEPSAETSTLCTKRSRRGKKE